MSFWGHLKGYVGPMLGRFGSMLGLCWVIWWAMWGSMDVSGMKNSTPTGRPFGWGSFWGHLKGHVWPMLGRFGSMLGLCWAYVGSFGGLCGVPWRSLEWKIQPQPEDLSVEVHFGGTWRAMSDQCWAVLGLCWAYVGLFGGLCGVPWRSLEWKIQPQPEDLSVEVHFGGTWRAMSDQCWAVLGLCWAYVGSFGGPCGVPWRSLEWKIQPQPEDLSVEVHFGGTCHLLVVWNMFFFPYIGNNNPNWLSYFSEGWNHQPGILSFPSHLKLYYVNLCKFRVYWDGWNVCTCYFHVISFHMLDL